MTWTGPRVYVFGVPGEARVKVGFSVDPSVRGQKLRLETGLTRARLLYALPCSSRQQARAVEARAHELLIAHHIEREWFAVDAETAIDAIDAAVADEAPTDSITIHPRTDRLRSLGAKAAWETRRARYGRTGNKETAA